MTVHARRERFVRTFPMTTRIGDVVLLLGMAAALATFLRVVAFAMSEGERGRELSRATAMATMLAEEFAAVPSDVRRELGDPETGLVARCDVTQEEMGTGTLYRATIEVIRRDSPEPVYEVATSRYVRSDGGGGRS